MSGDMDSKVEVLCDFRKDLQAGTMFCVACGQRAEDITARGPVECIEHARAALAKYDNREHRGSRNRGEETAA